MPRRAIGNKVGSLQRLWRAQNLPLYSALMPMEPCFFVSTTKILICISESIISTIPWITGFAVSMFLDYFYPRKSTHRILGDFSPGKQPHVTHIAAEVVHGGDVDIIVSWRDEQGRPVSSSHSKTRGWDLPKRASEHEHLDGRDWDMFSSSQDMAVLRIGNVFFQDCGINICVSLYRTPCTSRTGIDIKGWR